MSFTDKLSLDILYLSSKQIKKSTNNGKNMTCQDLFRATSYPPCAKGLNVLLHTLFQMFVNF